MRDSELQSAWDPFVSSDADPWDHAKARHLYRRACFGYTFNEIETAVKLSPQSAVKQLLNPGGMQEFDVQMDSMGKAVLANGNPRRLPAWWLYRMLHSPFQLLEKTTLFWHGHFATSATKVENAKTMYRQNQLLRHHALGKLEPLVHAISKDPAMLIYLDSTDNRKTHPNENFARELLELFCLGLGSYSEQDIQQIARCFTGWQVRRDEFKFNGHQHDKNEKTFFGQRGSFGGDDAVRIVMQQPAAAEFIATKLYKFFVSDEPNIATELIGSLATRLRDSQFDIGKTIEIILSSQWFYSNNSVGRKIKSPVELAIGLQRLFGCSTNLYELCDQISQIGQLPFYPPNVKGWDGGTEWINSATLLGRSNLVKRILSGKETKWSSGDTASWLEQFGASSVEETVDRLVENVVSVTIPKESHQKLVEFSQTLNLNQANDAVDLIHAVTLLPEFQLN